MRTRWLVPLILSGALLLASCCPLSQMQPNIANGGRAVAVAVHPTNSNTILVASESGGIFRSQDRGSSWSQVSGFTTFWFNDVKFLPWDPSVVIATAGQDFRTTSGGGIWRSGNGGSSWSRPAFTTPTTACLDNLEAYCVSLETGRNRIWVGTRCGLAFSDDSGVTWQYLPPNSGISDKKVFGVIAPSAGRIVILSPTGVSVTTDGGTSWSHSHTGLPAGFNAGVHNQIAVSPYDPGHLFWASDYWLWNTTTNDWEGHNALYRSNDNGATWSSVIDNVGINRPPFVKTASPLSGGANTFDLYFGNGACTLERATVTEGTTPTISSWTKLNFDHCDPADLGFDTDNKTPLLLAGDGGLHSTADNGLNWKFIGGGDKGYDALQITEVIGQLHSDNEGADLYFGTQDNDIWASPDKGSTWTARRCCEGFYLNIPRGYLPAAMTKFTGVSCGACGNFISGPVLQGQARFPDPPNSNGAPRLLKPGFYVQNTSLAGISASVFVLTTNTGGSWTNRYGISETVVGFPQIAGPADDPVVYTPIKPSGTTPDGQPLIQIKRTAGVLGNGTPLVSNIDGFGSLGIFPTMFAWYKVYGADPKDPNFIMATDIIDSVVKVSTDAGMSWTRDDVLTNLVTMGGAFRFRRDAFSQITTFGFDPNYSGHILVGTQQAGVYQTFDRGGTWEFVKCSDLIPSVSSFFYAGKGEAIISSYGRGLWRLSFDYPSGHIRIPPKDLEIEGPLIYWKGAKVPISQIHDPDVCPVCGFYLTERGDVEDYVLDAKTGEVTEVFLSGGTIKGFTWDGKALPTPFKVTISARQGTFGGDKGIVELLKGKNKVKGLYIDGTTLKGVIVYSRDVTKDQLPRKVPLGPHISVDVMSTGLEAAAKLRPITVTGVGFNPRYPLEVLVDGDVTKLEPAPKFDDKGDFTFELSPAIGIGGHTILVRQKTDSGYIQDATTFMITVHDAPGER